MERRFRLTRATDIKRVRRFGKSFAHPLIVLIAHQNGREDSRIAVSAGKSVGNAVKRNRAKRLIRAAVQPLIPEIQPGWDLMLIARAPLADSSCQSAAEALKALLQESALLQNNIHGN